MVLDNKEVKLMGCCSKSLTRKSLLYKTGVEYGDYTINHVQGCSHVGKKIWNSKNI